MVDYKNLSLERKLGKKTFEMSGQTITVLQYLPLDEKIDLIEVTLNKSMQDGVYNPILLDKYFNLNILYCYTDIDFGLAKIDESDLYDILFTNGVIEEVLANMDENEYNYLVKILDKYKEDICKYRTSLNGIIRAAIDDLPGNAQKAVDILKNLDPSQFKELTEIADTLKNLKQLGKLN